MPSDLNSAQAATRPTRTHTFAAGLATNLGSPKAAVFAVSLLPQFVPPTGSFLTTAGFGIVWALVTAAWYVLFVWAVQRGRGLITRPSMHRLVNAASGMVLVSLGGGVVIPDFDLSSASTRGSTSARWITHISGMNLARPSARLKDRRTQDRLSDSRHFRALRPSDVYARPAR